MWYEASYKILNKKYKPKRVEKDDEKKSLLTNLKKLFK